MAITQVYLADTTDPSTRLVVFDVSWAVFFETFDWTDRDISHFHLVSCLWV